MGLFSNTEKTAVSTQVYRLGGDDAENYIDPMKATILSAVLTDRTEELPQMITTTVKNSPAKNHERFYRWVVENDPDRLFNAGIYSGTELTGPEITSAIRTALSLGPNEHVRIQKAVIDGPDVDYFAEGWLGENRPNTLEASWEAEWKTLSNEIEITRQGDTGLIEIITIPAPADLIWAIENEEQLLYVLYQVVTQDPVSLVSTVSRNKLFTYRMGSGNAALDAFETLDETISGFYPVYFLRRYNKSVREYPDEYGALKKAYKRLTGGSVDSVLDEIEDHDQIDDIDFVYLFQGVSLASPNQADLEYIYRFMELLREAEPSLTRGRFNEYGRIQDDYEEVLKRDQAVEATKNESLFSGLFQELAQDIMERAPKGPPFYRVTFTPGGVSNSDFDKTWDFNAKNRFRFDIKWHQIVKTFHSGNARHFDGDRSREKLKIGEFWIANAPYYTIRVREVVRRNPEDGGDTEKWVPYKVDGLYVFWQYDTYRYVKLHVVGMVHENFIYSYHKHTTSAHNEQTKDVSESGFLIPLHHPTLQLMPKRRQGQLAQSSSYLVFNAYEKYEVPWWSKGVFKVLLFVAAFAVSFWLGGAGIGAAAGILGTNAAVGAALGFTGVMAAAVGAAVNMLTAVVITSLVQWGATELLGEKWGLIVGTILSFFAINMAANFVATGSFAFDWSVMFQADNLLKLTNSVGDAYSRWLAFETQELQGEMVEAGEEYAERSEEIQELYDEVLGDGEMGPFDPMLLTDSAVQYGESRDAFLSRTLLTGSDIAALSTGMVSNFVDATLTLPGAIR